MVLTKLWRREYSLRGLHYLCATKISLFAPMVYGRHDNFMLGWHWSCVDCKLAHSSWIMVSWEWTPHIL